MFDGESSEEQCGNSIRDVLELLINNVNKFRQRSGRNDSLASTTNEDVSRNNKTQLGNKQQ